MAASVVFAPKLSTCLASSSLWVLREVIVVLKLEMLIQKCLKKTMKEEFVYIVLCGAGEIITKFIQLFFHFIYIGITAAL